MRAIVFLVVAGCIGSTKSDTTPTGPTGDTGCEVLEQTCLASGSGSTYGECPSGYTCSGIPAYWCYKGPTCSPPECLPPAARIDTPFGPRPVADLAPGDPVWTWSDGRAVVAPILQVRTREVPDTHTLMDLVLADGRELRASPGHPTVDGRRLGDLTVGDALDGAVVVRADRVRFGGDHTWDLLPAGSTGGYWADGVLVGSTLASGAAGPR